MPNGQKFRAAVINHPLEAPGLLWSNLSDRIADTDAEGIRCRSAGDQVAYLDDDKIAILGGTAAKLLGIN